MLQAFARKSAPPGRAAHQEAFAARIRERPDQIAHPLESEHRIVNEERNHRYAVIGVRRSRRQAGRHGARLRDPLLQHLPVLRFLVIQQNIRIHRLVALALAGVNAELAEQALHPERARFVRHNRHHQLAQFRMLHQRLQHADERRGSGSFAPARPGQRVLECVQLRRSDLDRLHVPCRQRSAHHALALAEVLHLSGILGRLVEADARAPSRPESAGRKTCGSSSDPASLSFFC